MESFYRYTTGPGVWCGVAITRHPVDLSGIEPLISAMRMRRITSCATGPNNNVIIAENMGNWSQSYPVSLKLRGIDGY